MEQKAPSGGQIQRVCSAVCNDRALALPELFYEYYRVTHLVDENLLLT